ncbi:MAG: LysR family transcriptional regulator [Verrucomicrobiota bacterium]
MISDLLDARRLQAFVYLIDTQSFTTAAKRLGLTQSAVSHSIKVLEEDIGCPLIQRLGKTARPTEEGQKLYEMSQKILMDMSNIRQQLGSQATWTQNQLRIGATTSVCQYLLPSVIREFKESFPDCRIFVYPADSPQVTDSLQRNEIDIAIALKPMTNAPCDFRPLFEDQLYFMTGAMHPWATQGKATPADISKENFILYSQQSNTYRIIEDYFNQRSIQLHSSYQLGSLEVIKELVKVGVGVSVGSHWIAEKERKEGSIRLVTMGGSPLIRSWGILSRTNRRLSLVEETFMGLCQLASENLPDPPEIKKYEAVSN